MRKCFWNKGPMLFVVAAIAMGACFLADRVSADSFDWRNVQGFNWNSPVRDQFGGTCWAFGATAAFEAKYKLTRNDPLNNWDLSEQQLVWETNPDLGDSIESYISIDRCEGPVYANGPWATATWKGGSTTWTNGGTNWTSGGGIYGAIASPTGRSLPNSSQLADAPLPSIANNSLLQVPVGGSLTLESISGGGTTFVSDLSQLTAKSIVQDTLIIGGAGPVAAAVPEPGVLVLLLSAGIGILGFGLRRRSK